MTMVKNLHEFDEPLSLGGDGRSDSPSHSAKYGAYTLLDLHHNMVLDVELVQVSMIEYCKCIFFSYLLFPNYLPIVGTSSLHCTSFF